MSIGEIPDWVKIVGTVVTVGGIYWKLVAWKTSTDKKLAKLGELDEKIERQNEKIERQNERIEKQNEKFFEMLKEIRDNREEMRLATKKD